MNKIQKTYSFFDKEDCIKLIRIMKLTFIFALVAILQVSAATYSQSTKITLKVNSATVQELINIIEAQSDYTIFYKDNQLDASRTVNLNVKNATIAEVLNSAFLNTDLSYKVLDKIIVITNNDQIKNAVTGKVTSANDGQALPGVNVSVKGTNIGTITDLDGNYTIEADASKTLVFSFMGYITQEIAVNSQNIINVVLVEDTKGIDEVLVVGYGVKKKSLITGAISQVGTEDVISSAGRAEQALQGKAAGVSVLPNSGAPGTGMKVSVRGVGSNNGSNPLYIVDGMKSGDINYLNPDDVESMEILKDAASAAIYGTEGANGVVLIKTKSGKRDRSEVNYSFQYGFQSLAKSPKTMDANEYATFETEAFPNASGVPNPANFAPGSGTNWFDASKQTAPMQKHYISFSGGNEKNTYMISAGYSQQDGIFGGSNAKFERLTGRINGTHQVKNWMETGVNLSYEYDKRATITEFDGFSAVIGSMYKYDPTVKATYTGAELPVYMNNLLASGQELNTDDKGNYFGISPIDAAGHSWVNGESHNPLMDLYNSKGRNIDNKVLGNVYVKITPFKGFSFTSRAGMDLAFQNTNNWNPNYYSADDAHSNTPGLTDNDQKWTKWTLDNFADYAKSFGSHNFTLMVGMAAEEYSYWALNTRSDGNFVLSDDQYRYPDYMTSNKATYSGGHEQRRQASYFGRLSYDFSGKYLFEASMRRDGSSLFGPDNKFGNFPSVSAGWVLSNESFWTVTALSFAKVRASWGRNGSLSNLGVNQYLNLTTSKDINYPNGTGTLQSGIESEVIANSGLKWETSEQTDLGIDLRALNNRLSFTFDWYDKRTKDLLNGSQAPGSIGGGLPYINAGDVENKGLEFQIGMKDKTKDFSYDINFNIAFNKNEVTKVVAGTDRSAGAALPTLGTLTWFEKGMPIWYYRGYKVTGIYSDAAQIAQWKVDNNITDPAFNPAPGDPIVADLNGDGIINDRDMTKIGDPNPKTIYGANITLGYKGFDLNIFMQGVSGVDNYLGFFRTDRPHYNELQEFYTGRWTTGSTTAQYPRPGYTDDHFLRSSLLVRDGSYFKIRQIQLGYTIPSKLLNIIKISNLRVFASLNDFFTFSKYPGLDPEVGATANNAQGIDFGSYPVAKKVLFGVSVTF